MSSPARFEPDLERRVQSAAKIGLLPPLSSSHPTPFALKGTPAAAEVLAPTNPLVTVLASIEPIKLPSSALHTSTPSASMPAPSPEAPASKAVDQPTSGLGAPVHTALERPTSGVEPPARRPVAQLPTTDMMELYEQLKDEAVQKGVSVSQARGSALGGFLDEATRLGSGLRDEVVAMVEAELRQATASLRHEVGAFLQPRLEQHIASLRVGLEAEDAVPLLACVDTLDEVRAALQDPSAFVHDVLGAALVRAGMARLKPLLLRQASDHGLGAEELNAALDLVDSIEEVRAAMAAPEAFVRRLVEEAVGPAATKLALARLRPLLERRLEQLERRMPWADFEAAIAVLEWGGEWGGVSGAVPGGGRLVQELRDALRTPEAWLDRRLSALLRALEELDSTVDGTVDGTRSTPTVMRRAIGAARAASAVGGARYGASSASNAASSISAMAADAAAQASAGIDGLGRLGTELLDDLSTRLQSLPRRMAEAATAVLQSSLQSSLAMASGTSDMQPSALLKSTMKSLINESLTTLLVEEVTDVFSRALRGLSVELPYAELGAAGAALGEQVHRARWALEQAMAATVHRVEEAARLVEQSVEGLLERVGGALDEAVASAGDLLSELTGEMSNLLSEVSAELPAHVQVVLGFLRPFLVDGAVYLVGAKTPHVAAAHDAQRGERLRREHCDWAVINAPFYHLGERPLLASVSTLVFFAAALWLMGVSYFFVPSTAIDANRTLDGDEIWLIQNQYGRWQEDGTALGNLLFYAALATIPFMLLVGFKFLINHGKLSVCGALIAKLETHYGISVAQVRGYDVQRRKLRRKQPRPQPAGDKRSRVRHGSEEPPPPGEKGGAAEGGRRGDGTDETDARERLGRRAEPIRRVDNFITERTRWNCWLCLITALVSELLVLATFLLFDGRLVQVLGSADAYFGLYMGCHTAVLLVVIIPISLPVAFASFNLMVVQTELLRQNFVAYSGLLDMLCLKVCLLLDDAKALSKGAVAERAHAAIADDPLVLQLREQLRSRERFLLAISRTLISGPVSSVVNAVYALFLLCYFLFLFYIALSFLLLQAGHDVENSGYFACVAITMGVLLSLVAVSQPLLHMAGQAKAWDDICKSCKATTRQEAAKALSDKNEPLSLFVHHDSLREAFTWTVLGLKITYPSVFGFLATYASLLFTTIIVPAIVGAVNQHLENDYSVVGIG